MKIEQTKCDHCGKIHETRHIFLIGSSDFLSVPLKVNEKTEYFDFCDENCLLEYLTKRRMLNDQAEPRRGE